MCERKWFGPNYELLSYEPALLDYLEGILNYCRMRFVHRQNARQNAFQIIEAGSSLDTGEAVWRFSSRDYPYRTGGAIFLPDEAISFKPSEVRRGFPARSACVTSEHFLSLLKEFSMNYRSGDLEHLDHRVE